MYFVVQKHNNITLYNNLTKYSLMSRDMRFPTNGDILTSVDSDEPVQSPFKLKTQNDVQSVA